MIEGRQGFPQETEKQTSEGNGSVRIQHTKRHTQVELYELLCKVFIYEVFLIVLSNRLEIFNL